MSAILADANVLIALMIAEHVHHEPAQTWFAERGNDRPMAICPITEGALVRTYVREGFGVAAARADLAALTADRRVHFWPDDVCYSDADLAAVHGHRQVTDAYLASLAGRHSGHVATFDKGLVATYPNLAILIG